MDFSSEHERQLSAQRRLAFASRWKLEDEPQEEQSKSSQPSVNSILHEPCVMGDTCVSLPVELFALSLEDLVGTIFTVDTWNSLDPTSKAYLKTLLPSGPHAPAAEVSVGKLFSGENVKFGNPTKRFTKDLLGGEYNAEVQKYKQQAKRLAEQQRLLAMKVYHNKMVKHALEHKRKLGLKVDEAVMDFYRTQPDDSDVQEKRRLDRAHAALTHRIARRKGDKQFSSILAAASQLAAKQDAEGAAPSSAAYKLTHALSDIGVQIPMKLQVGLPYGDDDIYLSDDDDRSSATASQPSDNEADIDELLEDMESSATGGADGRKKNVKKRKRDDADAETNGGPEGMDVTGATGSTDVGEKKKDTTNSRKRKKFLPPLPIENIFSFFPTIRSVTSQELHPKGVPLTNIIEAIKAIPKLVDQVPHGMNITGVVSLAVGVLLQNPAFSGFSFSGRKQNIFAASDVDDGQSGQVLSHQDARPFLASIEPDLYVWNLPAVHSQNDFLQSYEALFFFALTRRHLTKDGKKIDFEQTKTVKAQLTLPAPSEASVAEYRAQEAERYTSPELPYTFKCSQPIPGHSAKAVSPPSRKSTNPGGRRSVVLRQELPEKLSTVSIVRDALCRLPGGVGTRSDVSSLMLQSQYLAAEVTDITHISHIVASTLDRLHLEYDCSVRYDVDLRLYIYLHRERTEADFLKMKALEEKVKGGDTGALWTSFHDALEPTNQASVATLNGFLQSNTTM